MTRFQISTFAIALLACHPVFADEESETNTDAQLFAPAASIGFCYPLIFSVSVGALLPLVKQSKNNFFPPTSLALRVDGEIGLGGGSAGAGLYIPVGGSFAINFRAARMRTWLLAWNEETNRIFDGGIAEFVLLGHVPGKIGLAVSEIPIIIGTTHSLISFLEWGGNASRRCLLTHSGKRRTPCARMQRPWV